MNQLNLYYRAFKDYKKHTQKDRACIKQRQRIKEYSTEFDKLETIRTVCKVDENWVEQIELGLPFVEKAIAEERQFIKNEGEVLDIEKVKRVSKDSVEHLAKHSDLITHVPKDGGDIIPDKVYMVERLSDYAVYENRFLYMLLCYTRDFIDSRLKKIKELGNTYKANTYIKRDMQTNNGRIYFECTLVEESKKDPFTTFDKNSLDVISRIESCQHYVASLLSKPLMVIVSKTPMIKPPITKTNVLKMNSKFKNAVALYEYLSAYQGIGYEIIENKKLFSPFSDEIVDDIAEITNLTSFLTYQYGNDIKSSLENQYQIEQKEIEETKRQKLILELGLLKEKLEKGEIEPEEYIYNLEKTLNDIKVEYERLKQISLDFDVLKGKHENLKNETINLNKMLTETEQESREKSLKIEQLTLQHKKDLEDAEEKRLQDLEKQSNEMTALFNEESTKKESEFNSQIEALKNDANTRYDELKNNYDELFNQNDLVKAELHAIKGEKGLMETEDFSSEEKFAELEREFVAFYDLFNKKWKVAKKQIRQKALWSKFKKIREQIDE